MFMKQYNYKPRSNSTSSQGSQSGSAVAGSPPKGADAKPASVASPTSPGGAGAVSAGIAGRRRVCKPLFVPHIFCPYHSIIVYREPLLTFNEQSSAAGGEKFAGLNAYKRGSQDDKKASFAEQKVGGGVLGGMWESFTKK